MEGNDELDMTNATTKFCVSWVTIQVIESAVRNFIAAWNSHRIPGNRGGIPNDLANHAPQTTTLPPSMVSEMVALYRRNGCRLTPEHTFGTDPLEDLAELKQLRQRDFFYRYPNLETLFSSTLHGDGSLFKEAKKLNVSLDRLPPTYQLLYTMRPNHTYTHSHTIYCILTID